MCLVFPSFFHPELIWDGDMPETPAKKIIVGVGYPSQHPWDESLQAEDELETLKKRYQKNMALVSRQAKVLLSSVGSA